MIKRVLALWDEQDPQHFAIKKAVDIAQRAQVKLDVLACVSEQDADPQSRNITHLAERIHQEVENLSPAGMEVEVSLRLHHDIAQAVNEYANEHGVDLVVATTNAHAKGDHDPHIWDLIRNTPLPLFIVTRQTRKIRPTLLATVDINQGDKLQQAINAQVLSWSQFMADLFGQNVEATYNLPMSKVTMELDVFQPGDILNRDGEEAAAKLQQILLDNGVDTGQPLLTAGDTANNLNKTASKLKADIMVVGSVGRKGLKGLLLGNTVENVLKHARSNVLVVRPG